MAKDKKMQNTTKSKTIYISKKQNKYKERTSSSKFPKIFMKLIVLIIFCNSISLSAEKSFKLRKLQISSRITMTIRGNGTKNILGEKFNILPSEVNINDNNISYINKSYSFEEEKNIVTLTFNTIITNCSNMFSDLIDVIDIDLSNFDSSGITDMTAMFKGCINLEKINLTNFNTSMTTNMKNMFLECKALNSLDLSEFDTSLVTNMYSMFYGCRNLKNLNIKFRYFKC